MKRKHKPDDPEQSRRFIEMARLVGAGEGYKLFEKVLHSMARYPLPRDKGGCAPTASPTKRVKSPVSKKKLG